MSEEELTRTDWEKIEKDAMDIVKSLKIQLIHAKLMLNKAKRELIKWERETTTETEGTKNTE